MVRLTEKIEHRSAPSSTVLETEGLRRRFDKFVAVDCLDISVKQGEVFGLLGPNGAGKSTVIKMLTTLLPPSGGRATLAGYDIAHQPENVRKSSG